MAATDFRALCAELLDCYDLKWRARERIKAALAQHKPEPEEPTKAEIHAIADALLDGDSASRIDFAIAVLARWGTPNPAEVRRSLGGAPQPTPVSERLPGLIEQALIKAECALSDIAEGEAEESEGDPLEWAEKRAADALARIRPVMRQHQIQTSEWPPLRAHALPIPRSEND